MDASEFVAWYLNEWCVESSHQTNQRTWIVILLNGDETCFSLLPDDHYA